MTTLTQYLEQVREEYWRKFAERFNVLQEQLFEDSADFWEAKIRERESALRLEIEGIVKSPAYENLKQYQGQLDEDGVCVAVSRQALDEVMTAIARVFDGGIIQDKR